MTTKKRKTRSDLGKVRKVNRKRSTHIRIDEEKKPFMSRLAKMPLEFLKNLLT